MRLDLAKAKPDDAVKAAREAVDIFRQVDERAREAGSVILIAEIYHSKNEDEKVRSRPFRLSLRHFQVETQCFLARNKASDPEFDRFWASLHGVFRFLGREGWISSRFGTRRLWMRRTRGTWASFKIFKHFRC